jgi:hypothetical protein
MDYFDDEEILFDSQEKPQLTEDEDYYDDDIFKNYGEDIGTEEELQFEIRD